MPFNTYIDDKDMIPTLLDYGWITWKETWTDCPYPTYKRARNYEWSPELTARQIDYVNSQGVSNNLSENPDKRSTICDI